MTIWCANVSSALLLMLQRLKLQVLEKEIQTSVPLSRQIELRVDVFVHQHLHQGIYLSNR